MPFSPKMCSVERHRIHKSASGIYKPVFLLSPHVLMFPHYSRSLLFLPRQSLSMSLWMHDTQDHTCIRCDFAQCYSTATPPALDSALIAMQLVCTGIFNIHVELWAPTEPTVSKISKDLSHVLQFNRFSPLSCTI